METQTQQTSVQQNRQMSEQEKKSLADRIGTQFDYCEVTTSKHAGEIRSIKGVFEIRFPSRKDIPRKA
jgi:hypothetical protein